MTSVKNKGGVNRTHQSSFYQKITFSFLHLLILVFSGWLIYFNGITEIGKLFSHNLKIIDPIRANILFACIVLYWLRHNITLFYLLVRKVEWSEVFGLLSFFTLFEIGLLLIGGGLFRDYPIKIDWLDIIACILLLSGSFLNSFSEIQRKWWKRNSANKGHCYTGGLFKYSMHINYFGDVVLFTGWSLFTHCVLTLALPLLMGIMFVFIHIPSLDDYLLNRYGNEFKKYSKKTKKLIPLIY